MKTIRRFFFGLICLTISVAPLHAQWVQTGFAGQSVFNFAVSGTNLFAGTVGGGVFLSTNNGTSWTEVNTGMGRRSVRSLAVSGMNLFAGTSVGVFLSTNNGTSWTAVNTGLTNTDVISLGVSGTHLFAGTVVGGVWRRPLADLITSVEQPVTNFAAQFSLSQNYRNPFNTSTTIGFHIPRSEFVTLEVFNLYGQKVATLVSEYLAPGAHEVKWDASARQAHRKQGMASGIYFYRLQAGDFAQTKKLILER